MDCWGVGAVSGLLELQTFTPLGCQSSIRRIVATLVLSVAFTPKEKERRGPRRWLSDTKARRKVQLRPLAEEARERGTH